MAVANSGGRWQIDNMPKPVPKPEKERREAEKADRLAEQLRANLRRRKAQARELDIPLIKPED